MSSAVSLCLEVPQGPQESLLVKGAECPEPGGGASCATEAQAAAELPTKPPLPAPPRPSGRQVPHSEREEVGAGGGREESDH